VRLWLAKQALGDAILVGSLFLLAGTLAWLPAWLMAGLLVGSQLVQWGLIGRRHPDLLAERSGVREGVDRSDVPLALGMAYGPFLAALAAALDVRLHGAPPVEPAAVLAGLAVILCGMGMTLRAMATNRFFAPVVRIQVERGHAVVDRGPYRFVRHPGYLGALLYDLALPALLGSWWAVPFALASAAIAVVRTVREDRYLKAHLAGYPAYAQRVRWRMIPGVW
jgi:protein-S-isoprenylcysteine O-methyltransferase Ste14